MKILLLSQWFDPEPAFKGLAFAGALKQRGHEVEVLTGFPNYPGGKVYPGYRIRPWKRETIDGIRVTRVALYPSHDMSRAGRLANYASFALTASIGALLRSRPDVVYAYHPPATIAIPAMVLKWVRGVPFVLDVQDLWPDTLAATGMFDRPALLRAVGWFCRVAYRAAARIVVLSPGFRRALVDRGVSEQKVEVVYNWSRREQQLRAPDFGRDRFDLVFAGNMGRAQGLDSVLRAAQLLAGHSRIRFVFVGGGLEQQRLQEQAAAMSLSNVEFLPARSPEEVEPLLEAAGALLVHLRDDPLFAMTIPSKTQTYLAAGRPIVMAVRGDAADLVALAEAGVVVPPEDPEALAEAVRTLSELPADVLEAMGRRGREYYERHLCLESGVERFDGILHAAAVG